MNSSISSSTSSSCNGTESQIKGKKLNSSPSLANISIFENEEYFAYFHKLLEQFNYMDFNLNLLKEISNVKQEFPSVINNSMTNASSTTFSNSKTTTSSSNYDSSNKTNFNKKPIAPSRKLSARRGSNVAQPGPANTTMSSNSSQNTKNSTNNSINQLNNFPGNNSNSSGFNFKSISKKFNIKSWFTSSNSYINQQSKNQFPTSSSNNHILKTNSKLTLQNPIRAYDTSDSNSSHVQEKYTNKKSYRNIVGGLTITNKRNSDSSMKHSLSEPSINALIL
jgi:hypothetical protein